MLRPFVLLALKRPGLWPALLSAAQAPDLPLREPAEPEALVEARLGHRVGVVGGHERDDLAHLEPGRERGDLRGRADPPPNPLVARRAAEEARFPAVGQPEPEEEAERGGLARPVRAEEGEERASGEAQVEPR